MAEYADDPFQMDEDFLTFTESSERIQYSKTQTQPPEPARNDPIATTIQQKNNENSTLERNLPPRYTDPTNIYTDDKSYIRSRLSQFKLEEMGTTTEEDEAPTYEEDIDDKYDKTNNKKQQDDYTLYKMLEAGPEASRQPLTPPENFAPVINRIYRSSFPQPNNFSFLKKLKLKSVLCLIPEEYPKTHEDFFQTENIKLFQLGMSGNKEPFVKINHDLITEAIKIVIDPNNQPVLIHCNRGKHRTGCLVGVLRRLQKWSLTIIFDEYRKFAAPKERPMDQQFIELYDETGLVEYAESNKLLPLCWD